MCSYYRTLEIFTMIDTNHKIPQLFLSSYNVKIFLISKAKYYSLHKFLASFPLPTTLAHRCYVNSNCIKCKLHFFTLLPI